MGAIFGILRFDGSSVSARELERMGNVLAHRGPDGRKFVAEGSIGLGHCLMRVNQEDLFERQPLRDRDADLTLIADCRIDNREELAGIFGIGPARLRDMPDSALVLRAYKEWGENCAEHLLGDFAFAVWDGRAGKLVLARDHMGQRTVRYHRANRFFAFATEIKALWALPDVPRRVSEEAIGKFILADQTPREGATMFEDICAVTGGTTLTIDNAGELSKNRYWMPRSDPAHVNRDERYYIENYRRIFTEAVECRVRRLIGPPALLLSAGYDSGAIAGLCGPVLRAKGRKLITVSSVMPEGYEGPLRCARRWVEICRRHMPHLDVRYFVRRDEDICTDVERTFYAADTIPHLGSHITGALFREASGAGARLIMDGLLGDETLNPRGVGALAHFLRTGQLRRLFAELGPHLRASGHSLGQTLRGDIARRLAPYWIQRAWQTVRRGFAPAWADRAIAPDFARAQMQTGATRLSDMVGYLPWNAGTPAQRRRSLNNWTVRDRFNDESNAAACGLELTRPLADKRVVEFGLAIPEELHCARNGRYRDLACRALADVYPPAFQNRGRRQDWLMPDTLAMFRAAQPRLKSEVEVMSRNPNLHKYIDFKSLERLLAQPAGGQQLETSALFALRTFRATQYLAWFCRENR